METKKQPIVVLTGISGSGKTTLSQVFPEDRRLVSYTTRKPRPGEVDGIDYYFLTKEQAKEIETSKNSFESTIFKGNHYGLTVDEVLDRSDNFGHPTVLVAEAGFYKDVTETEDGTFFYKGEYPIIPIILDANPRIVTDRIQARGGLDASDRTEGLFKELDTIVELKHRFKNIREFKSGILSIQESQLYFKDVVNRLLADYNE